VLRFAGYIINLYDVDDNDDDDDAYAGNVQIKSSNKIFKNF